MNYLINPHPFYSTHCPCDLNYHSFSSFLHIDNSHTYITRKCVLPVLQMKYTTVILLNISTWVSQGIIRLSYSKQSLLVFTQSWYSFWIFFFTMVTGTTTYPIKPNTWETPMIPPSISIHNQVFIVLSSNTSYTYSFLFVLWPLPLFWQKSLNLFFCLGVLLCSCAICTLHKGTYLAEGLSKGRNQNHSPPWSLASWLRAVSLQRISFF